MVDFCDQHFSAQMGDSWHKLCNFPCIALTHGPETEKLRDMGSFLEKDLETPLPPQKNWQNSLLQMCPTPSYHLLSSVWSLSEPSCFSQPSGCRHCPYAAVAKLGLHYLYPGLLHYLNDRLRFIWISNKLRLTPDLSECSLQGLKNVNAETINGSLTLFLTFLSFQRSVIGET